MRHVIGPELFGWNAAAHDRLQRRTQGNARFARDVQLPPRTYNGQTAEKAAASGHSSAAQTAESGPRRRVPDLWAIPAGLPPDRNTLANRRSPESCDFACALSASLTAKRRLHAETNSRDDRPSMDASQMDRPLCATCLAPRVNLGNCNTIGMAMDVPGREFVRSESGPRQSNPQNKGQSRGSHRLTGRRYRADACQPQSHTVARINGLATARWESVRRNQWRTTRWRGSRGGADRRGLFFATSPSDGNPPRSIVRARGVSLEKWTRILRVRGMRCPRHRIPNVRPAHCRRPRIG